ncbi:MAG: hypothetical protein JWQ59_227, partial [Cryobacterium sp.]|nr:hypothetical protein [Cryobacterium sp.]
NLDRLATAVAIMREWRNWQTRWLQVPVPARAWGFKSPLAHTVVFVNLRTPGS